jgi:hypothetical protein
MEEWRDIEGWEGLYQVSNMGRVKSFCKGKERLLSQIINRNGYCAVHLKQGGRLYYATIHRLVAKSFIQNPDKKEEVNHIDGIKTNNRVENLEWVNRSENLIHAYKINLRKHKICRWVGFVNIFKKDGSFITQVFSCKAAAKWIKENSKISKPYKETISRVCRGERSSAYGFIFKYSKEKI